MKHIGLICCVVWCTSVGLQAQETRTKNSDPYAEKTDITYPYSFKMSGNPLVPYRSSTDPDVNVWDETVWMYCSQDHQKQPRDEGTYDRMDGYHAFSSKDLVNWTDHGEVIHSRNVAWGKEGWMWAPGAARNDGKYYLYNPHRDRDGTWRIGVGIGDTPAGPFTDIGQPMEGITGIDPKIFIDDDGQAYIYNNSSIIAKLKPNMIELAESTRKIDYAPQQIREDEVQRFCEGSYMHKKGGRYYYSYSNRKNTEFQGFYAMGDSPYGPFEWKGAFAPKPAGAQLHHSVIDFKKQWYCFYHINTPPSQRKAMNWNGERRVACFDRLFHNQDGTIKVMEFTTNWVPGAM